MATLEQIQAKLKKLQAQADALLAKKSQGVIEEIRELMEKHGLTTADIDAHTGGRKRRLKSVAKDSGVAAASGAKYQNLKTGATWSGRGRAPAWIAGVKDRSRFLVKDSVAPAASVVASESKVAGNYPRGPQPAKYQDPKSGATWSGRGLAPAWLRGAKDRSRFLIDDATRRAQPAMTAVAGKAATKKIREKKMQAGSTKAASTKVATRQGVTKVPVANPANPSEAKATEVKKSTPVPTKKVRAQKAVGTKPVVRKSARGLAQIPPTPEPTTFATAAETPLPQTDA